MDDCFIPNEFSRSFKDKIIDFFKRIFNKRSNKISFDDKAIEESFL